MLTPTLLVPLWITVTSAALNDCRMVWNCYSNSTLKVQLDKGSIVDVLTKEITTKEAFVNFCATYFEFSYCSGRYIDGCIQEYERKKERNEIDLEAVASVKSAQELINALCSNRGFREKYDCFRRVTLDSNLKRRMNDDCLMNTDGYLMRASDDLATCRQVKLDVNCWMNIYTKECGSGLENMLLALHKTIEPVDAGCF